MARTSAIGSLVLHLHERALQEGRIAVEDESANQVLDTIRRGYRSKHYRRGGEQPTGVVAGLELRQGYARSAEAKTIRQGALNRLRDFPVFLRAVDELGYTPQVLRAALSLHYSRLDEAELGSDENCILMDIQQATSRLDKQPRKEEAPRPSEVIALLAGGLGPQEVGAHFKTNGSRLVGRVLKQLSVELEGGYGKAE